VVLIDTVIDDAGPCGQCPSSNRSRRWPPRPRRGQSVAVLPNDVNGVVPVVMTVTVNFVLQ
jgi:hypothetical protein